jgi:hypothetical protein
MNAMQAWMLALPRSSVVALPKSGSGARTAKLNLYNHSNP